MRTWLWMGLLLLLVFGIGWTTRALADRTEGAGPGPDLSPPSERRGSRGFRRGGPYLATVEHFAKQLELSQQQQEQLAQLIHDTGEKVRSHESAISEVMPARVCTGRMSWRLMAKPMARATRAATTVTWRVRSCIERTAAKASAAGRSTTTPQPTPATGATEPTTMPSSSSRG